MPDGSPADSETRIRMKSLAIPPAWTDVWISPTPNGHIQATGRDARGRKQYRYHERWTELRDEAKFGRLSGFARALPKIRQAIDRDLRLPGLARHKVLAVVVRLLELTLIRVGNEEYARDNRSFGLSTMRSRHAHVDGSQITFRFRGKSGKDHNVTIRNRQLAQIVKRSQELPGEELFQYMDEGGQPQNATGSNRRPARGGISRRRSNSSRRA
jgi:DNA topoisomerase-1